MIPAVKGKITWVIALFTEFTWKRGGWIIIYDDNKASLLLRAPTNIVNLSIHQND